MSLLASPDAPHDSPGDAPRHSPGLPQSPTQVATLCLISTALQIPPPAPPPHVQHGVAPRQGTPGSLPVTPEHVRQMDLERLANASTTSSRAKNYWGSRNMPAPSRPATSPPPTQDVPHSPALHHPPPLDVLHSPGPQKSTPFCQSQDAPSVNMPWLVLPKACSRTMVSPVRLMPSRKHEVAPSHPHAMQTTLSGSAKAEKFMRHQGPCRPALSRRH